MTAMLINIRHVILNAEYKRTIAFQEMSARADMRPIAALAVAIQSQFEFCSSVGFDTRDLVRKVTF